MIFIRLLTFHLDNLVGSTNGLDPADLKSGRVHRRKKRYFTFFILVTLFYVF